MTISPYRDARIVWIVGSGVALLALRRWWRARLATKLTQAAHRAQQEAITTLSARHAG